MLLRLLPIILTFVSAFAESQTPAQDFFSAGVGHLQSQKLTEAQADFEKALEQSPRNPNVLFNLGLVHFKEGHKGWAAACWRKALSIQPRLSSASRALEVLERDLPAPPTNEDVGLVDQLQREVVRKLNWEFSLALLWVVMMATGTLWFKYFGERKKILEDETATVPFPISGIASVFALIFVMGILVLKFLDSNQPRGTVVAASAILRLSPDDGSPKLSELIQGNEVDLLQQHQSWVQVSIPGGASGWISRASLFQTSGQPL